MRNDAVWTDRGRSAALPMLTAAISVTTSPPYTSRPRLQFADAVYEVFGVFGGRIFDEEEHLDRLERSLREIAMPMPMAREPFKLVLRELARRNHIVDGLVYLQVDARRSAARSRGPSSSPRATLILTHGSRSRKCRAEKGGGVAVVTRPDERWGRCDIKSTGLLANVLAKTAAREAGAYEAWLIDREGHVTEGSSTTAWIVDRDGHLVTRDLDNAVLPGVTRQVLTDVAADAQISHRRAPVHVGRSPTGKGSIPHRSDGRRAADRPARRQADRRWPTGPIARRLQDLYRRSHLKAGGNG